MPVLKTSASDFTTYTKAVAQARPAGASAPKVNKVAVAPVAASVTKIATVILASKVAVTAASPKTTVLAVSTAKSSSTKRD